MVHLKSSEIEKGLLGDRRPFAQIAKSAQSGIYCIFANELDCLPSVEIPPNGAVYVGLSNNLATRNHFLAKDSSRKAPRRTLGAILKSTMELKAYPRSRNADDRHRFSHFRFSEEDERRLSDWMAENLEYAIAETQGDLEAIEKEVILRMKSPLNLTKWKENPQKTALKGLLRICADQAREWEASQI